MDARLFHKRLFDATQAMIPPGSVLVCAVSGGADSMALLHGLHAVNDIRHRRWNLHVAHLDHGLRDDSTADAAFVSKASAALGLACTVESIDVAVDARAAGETIEEAARRLRYHFLERAATSMDARFVAVGHQADDQAETVLHHIARGTGLRGLAGMPSCRPIHDGSDIELVRPLLTLRRVELLTYLEQRGLSYRHDPTNDDENAATRNRIRHQVLPLLEETVNPGIRAALLRLSSQAQHASEAITFFATDALNRIQIRRDDGEVVLSAKEMAALPASIRAEIVVLVLRDLGVGLKKIGHERIVAAAEAACGGGKLRRIELPGDAVVERRGSELHIYTGTTARRTQPQAEKH